MSTGVVQDESASWLQHVYFETKHSLSLFPLIGRRMSHMLAKDEWMTKRTF